MPLLLVRHGQASYGSDDYDRLSPLGEKQSRRLGERLAREGKKVRKIYSGPRLRHRQTAEHLIAAARENGASYPAFEVIDDLDELPARELVLAHGFVSGGDLFTSVLAAVRAWAAGTLAPDGVITAAEFVSRVEGCYRRLFPAADDAIVVTSGGPIAVALLRSGARTDIADALHRGLELANASLTLLGPELQLLPCDPAAHLLPDEITKI
jgi:broad specificity phosphatase PhoE